MLTLLSSISLFRPAPRRRGFLTEWRRTYRSGTRLGQLLLVAVLLTCSTMGSAAEISVAPVPENSEKEALHMQRIEEFGKNGCYEEALQEMLALIKLMESGSAEQMPKQYPENLFLAGKIYRKLNRPREAIVYFESYLRLAAADDSNRTAAENLLSGERAKLAFFVPDNSESSLPPKVVAPPPAPLPQSQESASPRDKRPAYKKWWFWTAIAGGVAGAVLIGTLATQPWRTHYANPIDLGF